MRWRKRQESPAGASGSNPLPPVIRGAGPRPPATHPAERDRDAWPSRGGTLGPACDATIEAAPSRPATTYDARTGTVGYFANSTSSATKTNTPLLNIPQSVSVLTKQFIQDQNPQGITDITRYVPGVAVHQGEGNRDELVIRGVDSCANFYVNGFRDDVQYFRDLYNTQSIEILKGPSALTFGRASGGGLVNRTLKEADGTRVYGRPRRPAPSATGAFRSMPARPSTRMSRPGSMRSTRDRTPSATSASSNAMVSIRR